MMGCFPLREELYRIGMVWALLCIVPLLLAAELVQRSGSPIHLPAPEAYRSQLADRIQKSSPWRQSVPSPPDWRASSSPKIEWRTNKTFGPPRAADLEHVDLYPEYRPGDSSTFDLSTREDQSLIKDIRV